MPLSSALLLTAGIFGVAVLFGVLWRVTDGRRSRRRSHGDLVALGARAGRVTLVQFSTQTCARCPQVSRMLSTLARNVSGVDHLEVDLTHRPELAAQHGVLSTPTTFLIGPDTTLIARFHGSPRSTDIRTAIAAARTLEAAA